MKKIIFLCLLLVTTLVQAQTSTKQLPTFKTGIITGTVLDGILNKPLPYVNVVIRELNDKIITGGITKDDGSFYMDNIPEGTSKVSIEYLGYKTVSREITIDRKNNKIDFGEVKIYEAATSLDEVELTAEVSTIQQKVDRKVITIGKDLTTSGPTASDIMNNLPSVSVDSQSGAVSLRGNANVRVMVDGKLSNVPAAQLLKQIPSTSIKSIELITNPSAKYNPEGMSGLINIILKKNIKIGFNGNINLGLNYQDNAKFNSSIDMNYRNGKLNFYGNYGNNISYNDNSGLISRPANNSEQAFAFKDNNKNHLFKAGVDFYLNEKNTVSFFTNQSITDAKNKGTTDALFYDMPSLNQYQVFDSKNDNNSSQYNFDYKLELAKEGSNLELEVDYNVFDQQEDADFRFSGAVDLDNYLDFVTTDRESTTVNLDYVNPLSDSVKLEIGVQARLFNTNIDYNSTGISLNNMGVFKPTPSTIFDYSRDIYSAYATYGKTFEKWTYQIGLRAENVKVNADALSTEATNETSLIAFDNDYFEVYPSAFFTYSPSEKNAYQLSFSRRVDRPGIGQINPIREWSTPLISSFGNQNLEPQFTNSIELNYTRQLKAGSVTAGVFYRAIQDEINQGITIDRTDVTSGRQILTHNNYDDTAAYGLELSSNYRPTKWWSLNASFDAYMQTQNGITEILDAPLETATLDDIQTNVVEVDNFAYNFRVFNNFKVTKKISLSAFAFYRGSAEDLQFKSEPMYFVNLGARHDFADGKGSFSLNFNDVFGTQEFGFTGNRPYKQVGAFNWESQTIFAGLSYRFGGGKYQAKSRKNRDNNEKSGGGFL
ncbi:outer membrane beta-barrel family protein [Lacinutrix sp. Bg11-31]|uniref:outer membrane beta-barrel family protein n=1 Tax=Lacinutrix sp. Bg11-31 TaxID=2057808 RepID=UPI000C311232|nr:outer membrane beta-barrel family protein [Lacinutrix sp. Bg11-31]AUC82187.1 TonB-dependent receptor [Lacinutrix sp. Bg11-31]